MNFTGVILYEVWPEAGLGTVAWCWSMVEQGAATNSDSEVAASSHVS
jgi:hypothetical protein